MKEKFNIVILDEESDKSKSFLDKLATFAINRVRKTLMPLLIKKFTPRRAKNTMNDERASNRGLENLNEDDINRDKNENNENKRNISENNIKPIKPKKRNRNGIRGIAFDPEIHIKKIEPEIDLTPMIQDVTVVDKEVQDNDTPVSSVTPGDIPAENTRIRNIVHKFFADDESGELHFKTFEEFVTFIDIQQGSESTKMPPLVSGGSQDTSDVILSELDTHLKPAYETNGIEHTENRNNERTETNGNSEHGDQEKRRSTRGGLTSNDKRKKKWKPKECRDCSFDAEKETYGASLLKNYGCALRCAGVNCGKYLDEIMKEKGNGAMVCNNCKSKKCEMVYCNKCYTDLGVTTKRNRKKNSAGNSS